MASILIPFLSAQWYCRTVLWGTTGRVGHVIVLMRIGMISRAPVIGEIYIPNRFSIGIELAGLVILSIAPIFLPKLGMRTFRFWIRDWISVLITRKLTIWKAASTAYPLSALIKH